MGTFKSKFKTSKFFKFNCANYFLTLLSISYKKRFKKIEQVIDRFSSIL